jgi:hypothetical protein
MSWFGNLVERVFGWRPSRAPVETVRLETRADIAEIASPAAAPVAEDASTGTLGFRTSATDRLDPRRLGPFSRARLNLRDAYTPSQPISDQRRLAGRSEMLETLIGAIEDRRLHAILFGERGIGKSSLLMVLAQLARSARYLTIYISCGAATNFTEVFRALAAEIPILYHGDFGPTSAQRERGGSFADLLPDGDISPRMASDILAKVTGTRILVLLDEFDRVLDSAFRESVAGLIKDLSDRAVPTQLVIAGVATNLAELLEYIPSIQRNIIALQVPRMSPEEMSALIKSGEASTGLQFDPSAIFSIAIAANGFPFLASLLAQNAALAAIQSERLTIDKGDADAALRQALAEFKGRISSRSMTQIDLLTRERLDVMIGALAGASLAAGGLFTAEDALRLPPNLVASNSDTIEHLATSGILIEVADADPPRTYRFREGGVAIYMWLMYVKGRLAVAKGSADAMAI